MFVNKLKIYCFLLFAIFFVFPKNIFAIYDPASVPNNHFGMHVVDTSNLKEVSKLVGDYGYVTIVIQKGERDPKRWQDAFDGMRRLHLIPIIRIASAPIAGNNNVWEKPSVDEIDGWVSFLNSLNWVVKNRYVTIGNEPNHANEWGGQIDPAGYAKYLSFFSRRLKEVNPDFFIMPAGLDASAGNTRESMDESLFLSQMIQNDSHVFDFIDGFASHSYPNPDFSGPGDAAGRGTVRTYDWELNYLKFLGVSKNLPVFITETGWVHKTDTTATDIGPKIEIAFTKVWSDKKIVAVTPFIFKYIDPPFDTFSWVNKEGNYYDFYQNVLNLQKTVGKPIQDYKADVLTGIFPKIATIRSNYNGILIIKNIGQSIWIRDNLSIKNLQIKSIYPENIEPGQIGVFFVAGKFPNIPGNYGVTIELSESGEMFNNQFNFSTNLISPIPSIGDILNFLRNTVERKLRLK